MTGYDAIILGTGGVGSAALFHLAKRGLRVLGIDRYAPGHDRGSSHGETRIIRQAYFEHSDYVPLLLRAYELWDQLEQIVDEQLLFPVGLLQVGPGDGVVVPGVLASAKQYGLELESLSSSEIARRFPGFRVLDGLAGVFEAKAGYLRVEACVASHLAAARRFGANAVFGEQVVSFTQESSSVRVVTDKNVYHAAKLIITAGPWAPQMLADLGIGMRVLRKHVYWFAPAAPEFEAAAGCPTFLFELPGGVFYGFPAIDSLGLKAAEHSGGEVVADPASDAREFDSADFARVETFLAQCLPGMSRKMCRHSVCYYTMSPDEHFIIDQHPLSPNIVFAASLSGHGFKFTSVLGEALSDLAMSGTTPLPIGFLGLGRCRE